MHAIPPRHWTLDSPGSALPHPVGQGIMGRDLVPLATPGIEHSRKYWFDDRKGRSDQCSFRKSRRVVPTPYQHAQHCDRHASDDENTFEIEEASLPPGYFTSPFFIGTMTGICLGLVAGVAGFGYIAPILGIINADIGPVSSNIPALTI